MIKRRRSCSDSPLPWVCCRLLLRLVDTDRAAALIERNLNPRERARLQVQLGPAYRALLGNPTGHYKLNMSNQMDRCVVLGCAVGCSNLTVCGDFACRDVMVRLLDMSNAETKRRRIRYHGLDTSQVLYY